MVGVIEVQYRARAGGGRGAGRGQDGAGVAARGAAEDAARGAAERADRMGGQRAVTFARGPRVAAGRSASAAWGCVLLRHQRNECARGAGGSTGAWAYGE